MKNRVIRNTLIAAMILTLAPVFTACAKTKEITAQKSYATDLIDEPIYTVAVEGTCSGRYSDRYYDYADRFCDESTTTDGDGHGPTGTPLGVIGNPQIMIKGTLYYYSFYGAQYTIPKGFEKIGKVLEVNDYRVPKEDFCMAAVGVRVYSGDEVYGSASDTSKVMIKDGDAFYTFILLDQ